MNPPAVGEEASVTRTFDAPAVAEFVSLTGDYTAARAGDVVPNALIGGMFSELLGTKLPGRGTNWLKQKLRFAAPALVGEPLTATVRVVRVRPEKNLVDLGTTCRAADGELVCEGQALVLCKEMEARPRELHE